MPGDRGDLAGPLHPDVGVIAVAPEEWMPRWQTRHHLLAHLARHFRVVWMNPPHDRGAILSRALQGGPTWRRAEGAPGLLVYTPPAWLPGIHRDVALARALARARLAQARRRLLRAGARRIVLSLWHSESAGALDAVPHDAATYHVNDEYTFSKVEQPIPEGERRLLARASATFFSSRALLERKGGLARRAVFLPNGVEFASVASPLPEPADLTGVPRPRVGYTGWVKEQLDWDLIESLARRRPDLQLVFAGAVSPQAGIEARIAPLRALPNVHFLGGKSSAELAAYPQHFDVCAMPYVVDDYTRYIYPLKLHEYLASGRPTIGTPIPTLREFAGVVRQAADAGAWSTAINELLGPAASAPEAVAARQAVARSHDWGALTDRLAAEVLALLRRD